MSVETIAKIGQTLQEMELKYMFANSGVGPQWVLPFAGDLPHLQVRLLDDHVYLGSDVLLELNAVPPGERPFLLKRLMQANDSIKLGRYAGVDQVRAECAIGTVGHTLSSAHLRQNLESLFGLVGMFREEFREERERYAS